MYRDYSHSVPGLYTAKRVQRGESRARCGFTLIELLIVVSLISILSSIAVANLLEAQVRARVARAGADLRSIQGAVTQYRLDNGAYLSGFVGSASAFLNKWELCPLTTPVAYLAAIPEDGFKKGSNGYEDFAPYDYYSPRTSFIAQAAGSVGFSVRELPDYTLSSNGPDHDYDFTSSVGYIHYDPSNGTASSGDIWIITFGTID